MLFTCWTEDVVQKPRVQAVLQQESKWFIICIRTGTQSGTTCSAKPRESNCPLEKSAVTACWLCTAKKTFTAQYYGTQAVQPLAACIWYGTQAGRYQPPEPRWRCQCDPFKLINLRWTYCGFFPSRIGVVVGLLLPNREQATHRVKKTRLSSHIATVQPITLILLR